MSTKAERELRKACDFTPSRFSANPQELSEPEGVNLESRAILDAMSRQAEQLTPADAIRLAQRVLIASDDRFCEVGDDYANFQCAQAVRRYVRKAVNALNGLSLS